MAEELKYTSGYDGATTDDLLGYAKEAKELKSNEYVRSMKEQLAAEDAETVQVYDVEGVPHKIFKKELISKAGVQLPSLEEIGGFVAYDTNGQALGLMSKEQVAQVVGGLQGISNKTLIIKDNIPDADEVYKYVSEGLTTIYVGNMANCPVLYGVLIHVQRAGKGDVTGSQIINQIIISNNKFYYRYGQGNDNSVQYESWI